MRAIWCSGVCFWLTKGARSPNVDLAPEEMRRRLAWWLREAGAGAEGADEVARRVPLVARAALGQY